MDLLLTSTKSPNSSLLLMEGWPSSRASTIRSYSLVTQSNPASGVHELSVIDQTKSFDSYVRYVQEQASRSSYKPGPPPVEWEPRLSQVDTPPRDAHATTGLDDLDPDDADEAAGAFAADGNRRTGRDGKGRQKFRPGPSVNAPSLFDDRVVTADQQYKRDRQSFLKRRSNETATTPGIRDRLKGPLRPGSAPKPSGTGGATAPKGTASGPASREELIQAIRKFKDDLREQRTSFYFLAGRQTGHGALQRALVSSTGPKPPGRVTVSLVAGAFAGRRTPLRSAWGSVDEGGVEKSLTNSRQHCPSN